MTEKNNPMYDGKTAAQLLRAARTTGRRKRELSTISKQLCIKEEFLEALESGNYDKIPELVYILGFARNYAIELELDPKMIVQKIKMEMGIIGGDNAEDSTPQKLASAIEVKKLKLDTMTKAVDGGFRFLRKYWKWLLAAAVILAAATFIVLKATNEKVPETFASDIVSSENAAPAPEFKIAVKESFGNENRGVATVALQATSETWLKVEDSRGETLFSRVMMPGDVYYAPAGGTKATVGNAGGLDVYVNGKPAPKLGADHARKSGIALTPAALAAAPAAEE